MDQQYFPKGLIMFDTVKIEYPNWRAEVRSTSFSFKFSFGASFGQTNASWRIDLSSEVPSVRVHRLQFGGILSRAGRCNRLQVANRVTRNGRDHR